MNWIIFYQNNYNMVEFLSSNNSEEKDAMNYYDFLNFVYSEIDVTDIENFVLALDSFKTVLLYSTGEWELVEPEFQEPSFEELLALNSEEQEQETLLDSTLKKSDNYLNKLFDFRKKNRRY